MCLSTRIFSWAIWWLSIRYATFNFPLLFSSFLTHPRVATCELNGCSGRGTCRTDLATPTCECEPYYYGPDCSIGTFHPHVPSCRQTNLINQHIRNVSRISIGMFRTGDLSKQWNMQLQFRMGRSWLFHSNLSFKQWDQLQWSWILQWQFISFLLSMLWRMVWFCLWKG